MSELKPCPFCGGEAALEDYGLNGNFNIIKCTECGARTKLFPKGLILGENVIEVWNRTIRGDKNTEEYQTKPLKQVPTIEPDIIECQNCRYYDTKKVTWTCTKCGLPRCPEDFCSRAERRADV